MQRNYYNYNFTEVDCLLGKEKFHLTEFVGQESISQPYEYSLQLISDDFNVKPEQMLYEVMTVQFVAHPYAKPRYFSGRVSRFVSGQLHENFRVYHVVLKPTIWFLNYNVDCRIYKNKNLHQIFKEISERYVGLFPDFTYLQDFQYKEREYCVQYKESTFNFLQRLIEEEGLFYYFRHEQNGATLVLGNKKNAFGHTLNETVKINPQSDDEAIVKWQRANRFYSGAHSQIDFDHQQADQILSAKQSRQPKLPVTQHFEYYRFPGKHNSVNEAVELIDRHSETEECYWDTFHGESNYTSFSAGSLFKLAHAPVAAEQGEYLITNVMHRILDYSMVSQSNTGQSYMNEFSCLPARAPYRPMKQAAKPVIPYPQTAIVVAAENSEIYTHTYGEVKVQFHWDRVSEFNEESSCWVRVAQPWSGHGFGMQFLPRAGQEVVVQFINGDPDQPVITGCLYNSTHFPPFPLRENETKSGFKTRSLPQGNEDEGNELSFEDARGNEAIYLHAQKDFNRVIENSENTTINNGDYKVIIKQGEAVIEAGKAILFKVGESQLKITPDQLAGLAKLIKLSS